MRRLWMVILPALLLTASGCKDKMLVMPGAEKEEAKEVKTVKMQEALFCFKCHSYSKYEGQSGGFPHLKHRKEFGINLHCNQCHDFKGHQALAVIKKSNPPCSNCH